MGDQGDTYGYRSQDEVDGWMKKDPIDRLRQRLLLEGKIDEATLVTITDQVQQQITDAIEFAKQAPYPDPSEVYTHVYA